MTNEQYNNIVRGVGNHLLHFITHYIGQGGDTVISKIVQISHILYPAKHFDLIIQKYSEPE